MKTGIFHWIKPVISAFLLAFSFEPGMGWFALIALVPLLSFIEHENDLKKILILCWIGGVIFYFFSIGWFLKTSPTDWFMGNASRDFRFAVGFVLLSSVFTAGLGWPIFALIAKPLTGGKLTLLTLPSGWLLSEYIKFYLFSLVFFGPGASMGPYWNFGTLGLSIAETPLIFWSRLLGLFGIGFLVCFINLAILQTIQKKISVKKLALFASIVIIGAFGLNKAFTSSDKEIVVSVLQKERYGVFYTDSFVKLLTQAQPPKADLFVAPENSQFFALFGETEKKLAELLLKPDGLIVAANYKIGLEQKEEIIYRNAEGDLISRQEKTLLVPNGEFLPFILEKALILNRQDNIVRKFKARNQLKKGDVAEKTIFHNDIGYGALSCSAVTTPFFYRKLAKQNADVLINSASQGLISDSRSFHEQIKRFAVFHAVANNKPFVQSASGGYSYLVSADGKLFPENAFDKPIATKMLTFFIKLPKTKTPYSHLGEWTWLISLVILIVRYTKMRHER